MQKRVLILMTVLKFDSFQETEKSQNIIICFDCFGRDSAFRFRDAGRFEN